MWLLLLCPRGGLLLAPRPILGIVSAWPGAAGRGAASLPGVSPGGARVDPREPEYLPDSSGRARLCAASQLGRSLITVISPAPVTRPRVLRCVNGSVTGDGGVCWLRPQGAAVQDPSPCIGPGPGAAGNSGDVHLVMAWGSPYCSGLGRSPNKRNAP